MANRLYGFGWIVGLGLIVMPISTMAGSLATGTTFQIPFARLGASLVICILIIFAIGLTVRAARMNSLAGRFTGLKVGMGRKLGGKDGGFSILETRRLTPSSDICRLQIDDEIIVLVVSQSNILVLYRQQNDEADLRDQAMPPLNTSHSKNLSQLAEANR
jgi:hypothetical protein